VGEFTRAFQSPESEDLKKSEISVLNFRAAGL
jgi:hypothetical protein